MAILTKYIDRIGHIHVKDVRRRVWDEVKAGSHSFLWGVKNGMFTVPAMATVWTGVRFLTY